MSTPAVTPDASGNSITSIISSIGSALIPQSVQTDLQTVETEIQLGLSVMVGLEFIIALELLLLVVMTWKDRG